MIGKIIGSFSFQAGNERRNPQKFPLNKGGVRGLFLSIQNLKNEQENSGNKVFYQRFCYGISYTAHSHKWNLFVISTPSSVIPNNVRNPVFLLRITSARNLSVRSGQA